MTDEAGAFEQLDLLLDQLERTLQEVRDIAQEMKAEANDDTGDTPRGSPREPSRPWFKAGRAR